MKKLVLLALAALMMVGCHDWNSTYKVDTKRDGTLYGTIMIDSCEYIRGNNRLAHKGNCPNFKPKSSEQIEEQIRLK